MNQTARVSCAAWSADSALESLRPVFSERLLRWFDHHGRHDLPWQHPRTPYRVWLSEIMLQQTQVATVIPYFQRFVAQFPDLPSLAAAEPDQVLALWAGLGYYSRARNLHAAAKRCVEKFGGELPDAREALCELPGIGRSTAAAILSQAFDQQAAILDGNVKRVLCRLLAVDQWPGTPRTEKQLWAAAERLMTTTRPADYTQAIMDFGATLCRRSRPDCPACPMREDCGAFAQSRASELPRPKPKRALPRRQCTVILLQDLEGRLLLQRREARGVWQGLWSLPEFAAAEAGESFVLEHGAQVRDSALMPIEHGFSHYHLQIQPICAQLTAQVSESPAGYGDGSAAPQRWCSAEEIAALGLPAPIRRLVSEHLNQADIDSPSAGPKSKLGVSP